MLDSNGDERDLGKHSSKFIYGLGLDDGKAGVRHGIFKGSTMFPTYLRGYKEGSVIRMLEGKYEGEESQ